MMKAQIIVHGGAWNESDSAEIKMHDEACEQAAELGIKLLSEGKSALDTVEEVVKFLENVPFLDAGIGSNIQLDGTVRMDASIMTSDLQFGAALQIEMTQHPISVARKILDYGYHNILTQPGVNNFAREEAFPPCDMYTQKEMDEFMSYRKDVSRIMTYKQLVINYREAFKKRLGTVGCVVRDQNGMIAAGTSTGGLVVAYPGRVGDSGLPGGGTYACKSGGASCTGDGEKIMLILLTKTVTDFMKNGLSAQEAAEAAIQELAEIKGQAGIICIDKDGNIGAFHNTSYMAFAQKTI